jgi:hypothetical protein
MTTLKLDEHSLAWGRNIVEVWFGDRLYATVTPEREGPGIRIISKHPIKMEEPHEEGARVHSTDGKIVKIARVLFDQI